MSVTAYREMGYLPDALVNYLVRLGWSHGDQEFFTREELIEKFSLEHIGKSAGIFNPEKLLALNAEHIKTKPPRQLICHLAPFLEERGVVCDNTDYLKDVIETLNTRSKTLIEMADKAMFYFTDRVQYDEVAARKFLRPAVLGPLKRLVDALEALDEFNDKTLERAFTAVMEAEGLKLGKIAQPVRVALTGETVSPGIFEMLRVLGPKRSLSRLRAAVTYIEKRAEGND
jgi:glutamyl-tRNA synthetase